MGMDLSTYIMVGYKTTRDSMWDNYPDACEQILDSEPNGIIMAQSEGSDDVVVGKLLHEVNVYIDDDSTVAELVFPDAAGVQKDLADVGILVPVEWVKPYCYASWG